jgi:hypothetical protein
MEFFFGEKWKLLNKIDRQNAEDRFIDGIRNGITKGIIFDLERIPGTREKDLVRDQFGKVLYKRIPSDVYRY